MNDSVQPRPSPDALRVAVFAVFAALAFQLLMVYGPHGGHWTGLHCFGDTYPVPAGLAGLDIHPTLGTDGYDGQFYYYIAQDPFLNKGYESGVDLPRFRYRRILVPLAAHTLAAGRPSAIAISYADIMLLSVFLGTFWLSRLAQTVGRRASWGLAFLLVPAVAISLDRSTVDIALAALCVGFVFYLVEENYRLLFSVLVAAPLVRETGLLLIGGFCGAELLRGNWRRVFLFSAAAIPTFAWYVFVQLHTKSFQAPLFDPVPLRNLLSAFANTQDYSTFGALAWLPRGLDRLGLLGAMAAMAVSFRVSLKDPVQLATLLFALLAVWHSAPGGWTDAYGYARSFTPLFLLLALDGFRRGNLALSIPMLLPLPRIALQLVGQLLK